MRRLVIFSVILAAKNVPGKEGVAPGELGDACTFRVSFLELHNENKSKAKRR